MRWLAKMFFPRDVREVPGAGSGQQAREESERELDRVRTETSYYAGLGDDLRRLRERNHFADNLRASIRRV